MQPINPMELQMDTSYELRESAHLERHPEDGQAVAAAAHSFDLQAFLTAFAHGNTTLLGYPHKSVRPVTVLWWAECEADMGQLLDLLRLANKSTDHAVRLSAQAILATMARNYADECAQ